MAKDAVFTLKLEPELRDAFMAAAEREHRPASQIIRQFMREYVMPEEERAAYLEFVKRKVALAEAELDAGEFYTDEEANAIMAAHLAQLKANKTA